MHPKILSLLKIRDALDRIAFKADHPPEQRTRPPPVTSNRFPVSRPLATNVEYIRLVGPGLAENMFTTYSVSCQVHFCLH